MSGLAGVQTRDEIATAVPGSLDHATLRSTWTKFDKQRRAAQTAIETVRIVRGDRSPR